MMSWLLGTLGSALWARLSDFTASHFWPSWSSKDPVYTPADPELAPKHTKDALRLVQEKKTVH